jgi:glycosyltransferase involved in cell wall biosynthesis
MLLSSGTALHVAADGRVLQAKFQADALEAIGHEVVRMEAWHPVPRESLDVLHVFEGGLGNLTLYPDRPARFQRIALAPFIDSNQPFWSYRLAASAHVGNRLVSAQYVLRRQALNADIVIARSAHERERFIHGMGIPEQKVHIVLNGMNPPELTEGAEVRARFSLPERFVLNVGLFTQARKNVLRLARAARQLGVPLVLAGTAEPGPALQELERMAKDGHVRMLGFVDRRTLEGLYAACDVFALPSIHEGTGLVAVEAASLGANVLITKNGGPPDYFLNLADYVDPESDADVVRGLQSAWKRPKTDDLRRHVLANLTWRQSAEQLVQAYEAIGH